MKKTIIIVLVIVFVYMILGELAEQQILVPNDAIRIRVIANSNDAYDQSIKLKVSDELKTTMYNLLSKANNTNEARDIINNNLDDVKNDVANILKKESYHLPYNVKYGYNYFPAKEYKGVKYDAGYYESLLVTLGAGQGDNWWCVLFPPLCLLEASETKSNEVEYRSFVKEILNKYF